MILNDTQIELFFDINCNLYFRDGEYIYDIEIDGANNISLFKLDGNVFSSDNVLNIEDIDTIKITQTDNKYSLKNKLVTNMYDNEEGDYEEYLDNYKYNYEDYQYYENEQDDDDDEDDNGEEDEMRFCINCLKKSDIKIVKNVYINDDPLMFTPLYETYLYDDENNLLIKTKNIIDGGIYKLKICKTGIITFKTIGTIQEDKYTIKKEFETLSLNKIIEK